MRVAVTGASGFMGGCLAHRLADSGHTVFTYGRRDAGALRRPLPNYTQWDIGASPLRAPAVDAVVHCAAMVGDWGDEADYWRVNVYGTRVVVESFAGAERFIHVSSASVYSPQPFGRHIAEDASVGSGLYSAYARSKAEAERLLVASGRFAVILRPQIVYGAGDTTLMPRVLAARRWGWLAVPGNGRNRMSVTHILNFVHAVECVLASSVRQGVFNVADREDATVDELLQALLRQNGVRPRLLYIPRPIAWAAATVAEHLSRRAGGTRAPRLTRYLVARLTDARALDLTRAYRLLGYAPCHSFRDESPSPDGN